MPKNLTVSLLSLFLSTNVLAQQGQTPPPIFKSKTELVQMPVIVTDQGQPVRGLTARDFLLLRDGAPEPIAVFEEVDAVAPLTKRDVLPPNTSQNYFSEAGDHRQDVVIVVLDFLNATEVDTSGNLRTSIKDTAKQLSDTNTPATVLLLSRDGLMRLQSFTAGPDNFLKSVERWENKEHEGPEGKKTKLERLDGNTQENYAADLLSKYAWRNNSPNPFLGREQATLTMEALEDIAQSFRGVPGRKKLIWMSPTFIPMAEPPPYGKLSDLPYDVFSKATKSELAMKHLADANIALYPVDTQGVTNPTWGEYFSPDHTPYQITSRPTSRSTNPTSDMLLPAQKTGGVYCSLSPEVCLKRDQADGNHYYLLGFYLHGDQKPGYHKVKVELNHRNASLRMRDGYYTTGDLPVKKGYEAVKEKFEREAVLDALASPLDYTAIPLRLQWNPKSSPGKKQNIELHLQSPPGGVVLDPDKQAMNLDYLAFIRPIGKTDGQSFPVTLAMQLNTQQQSELAKNGFSYRKAVSVAPGKYEVKVFLRDNVSGKTGTVSTVVEIPSS